MGTKQKRTSDFVITKTPLRVSFAGGGTDFPDFYREDFGSVVSTTISKYIYVTVKKHGHLFNEHYRLNYSETENVTHLDEIKNAIARECLRMVPVDPPVYISTVADLPSFSGLGSSSAFAVGLLNALHLMRGEQITGAQLAEEAAHVEIDVLKRPIGKQDHYASAIGGLNYFRFLRDHRVMVEAQNVQKMSNLFEHFMMFWTAIQRDATSVLSEQQQKTAKNWDSLVGIRTQAEEFRDLLCNGMSVETFSEVLNKGWEMKRGLASGISSQQLDQWYSLALSSGAKGGKLCGAGGGGFFLFVVPPSKQPNVRNAFKGLQEIQIDYEPYGTRALLVE